MDGLNKFARELKNYGSKNYLLSDQVDSLLTFLSAAQTNQESCLDGFSHDGADKKVRSSLLKGQMHVFQLCSNVLAMIKNITEDQMAGNRDSSMERRLREENEHEWPKWLSARDRRLCRLRL
ncbi:Pectinesterase/pectinesterase inhibitor 3 [Forsythia ovata]|uniref:Pectinesterase/pectinesterase inhibitor 3 n=1 Tax=Forsythia ovata TaxID=205694 RepID=A0ABD1SNK5_9LAMI